MQMPWEYRPLPIHELGAGAGVRHPMQPAPARVTEDSPALEVMTDLCRATPATIRPQAPLFAANQFMITRGVRLLLVVDDRENVAGVITATDILGQRAMRVTIDRGLRRDELTVADVMTPSEQVEFILFSDVERARVGRIVETLRRAGRQHVLVVDYDTVPTESPIEPTVQRAMVRGIFSLTQIGRQLGIAVQPGEIARTFAEIEGVLGH
jgi:CBS domain-containing protein